MESTLSHQRLDAEKVAARKVVQRRQAIWRLETAFSNMDEDGSGTLTLSELKESLMNPEIANRMKMIGFPVDSPETLFNLLDVEQIGELRLEQLCSSHERSGQKFLAVQLPASVDVFASAWLSPTARCRVLNSLSSAR